MGLILNSYTAYRAAIGGFAGTFSSALANDFRLPGILVKFEDFGANLCTNTTAYAFVMIYFHYHGDQPPPPKWRF